MRILKVAQTYYPYLSEGGRPAKVRAIAQTLVQRGHQVMVLTAGLGPRADDRNFDGIEAIYLSTIARYRAITVNPGVVPFCLRRLRGFDLVHIYGLYDLLGPTVAFFCRRFGIPYVVEPMGMFRPIVRNIRLKRLYHRLLGQRLIRGARYLIATSEQERQELVEGGVPEGKVVVRRNGIEGPERLPEPGAFRQRWGIAPEAKVVLFLGRLVEKKSPDLLIEAFARCLGVRHKAQGIADKETSALLLVIAGPDERDGYRERLEALTVQLGLDKHVLFTGPLYGDAKWAAYRDADVFVLPSQNENFGNTVAEAIACGTPVVVTDRCGIAPLVDGRAGLVVSHDEQVLAEALERILSDAPLQERFRQGCLQVAQGLSWDEPVEQMEALYRRMISR